MVKKTKEINQIKNQKIDVKKKKKQDNNTNKQYKCNNARKPTNSCFSRTKSSKTLKKKTLLHVTCEHYSNLIHSLHN